MHTQRAAQSICAEIDKIPTYNRDFSDPYRAKLFVECCHQIAAGVPGVCEKEHPNILGDSILLGAGAMLGVAGTIGIQHFLKLISAYRSQ